MDLEVGLKVKVGDEECTIVRQHGKAPGVTYVVRKPDGSTKMVGAESIESLDEPEGGNGHGNGGNGGNGGDE